MSAKADEGAARSRASLVTRLADRVMSVATERVFLTPGYASPLAQRITRFAARRAAWAAHTVKLLPGVEMTELADSRWSVTYIGDASTRRGFEHTLFSEGASSRSVGSVRPWALPRVVDHALGTSALLVCALPEGFPPIWRPRAPLSFRTPLWVDHWLDLTVPLDEQLAGTARQEVRHLVIRARKLDLTTTVAGREDDFRRFYDELLVPFVRRRHGTQSTVSSFRAVANRLRRPDFELIQLTHDGRLVAGAISRFVGPEATSLEAAIADPVPPACRRALPTKLFLVCIERALERGCRWFRFGGSRALCTDPVFRAKQRWGPRVVPRGRLTHPEWNWFARDLPASLAEHLNGLGLVTFHDNRSCVVRLGEAADAELPRLDGVDGCLMVSRDGHQFVAASPV